MRTVGQILKEARLAKFYTLEEIEKATKIRKELIAALESDDYKNLPPNTFIQGFIRNYGKFLNLDVDKLLAVFRREFSDQKIPPRILQAWINPLDKRKFNLTPTKVISGLVLFLLAAFFIYLWIEYRFLVGAPYLELSAPADKVYVESDAVLVAGKTDPESRVTINNQAVEVDLTGNFSEKIKMVESANTIIVSAISKSGKTTQIERTVFSRNY